MSAQPEPELAHCARCRRLYVRLKAHVCEQCFDMEEADFMRIRDVLAEDPRLTADEVASRAQVTVACVLRMLDEGLIANRQADDDAVCGRCGAAAISARQRLCTACLLDLDRQLTFELNQAQLLKKQRDLKATAHYVHELLSSKRRH